MLWNPLFEEEQNTANHILTGALSVEDEEDEDEHSMDASDVVDGATAATASAGSIPHSVPPSSAPHAHLQLQHLRGDHSQQTTRSQSPSEFQSDISSVADTSSSAMTSDDHLTKDTSHNTSHISNPSGTMPSPFSKRFPRPSISMGDTHNASSSSYHDISGGSHGRQYPTSTSASHRSGGMQAPDHNVRSYSSASRSRSRQQSFNHARRHPKMSRQSMATNTSFPGSMFSMSDGPAYGEALIVGKVEFDIDTRRGPGRWYEAWLESAQSNTTYNNYTGASPFATPGGRKYQHHSLLEPEPRTVTQNRALVPTEEQEIPMPPQPSKDVFSTGHGPRDSYPSAVPNALQLNSERAIHVSQSQTGHSPEFGAASHSRQSSLVPNTQDLFLPTLLAQAQPSQGELTPRTEQTNTPLPDSQLPAIRETVKQEEIEEGDDAQLVDRRSGGPVNSAAFGQAGAQQMYGDVGRPASEETANLLQKSTFSDSSETSEGHGVDETPRMRTSQTFSTVDDGNTLARRSVSSEPIGDGWGAVTRPRQEAHDESKEDIPIPYHSTSRNSATSEYRTIDSPAVGASDEAASERPTSFDSTSIVAADTESEFSAKDDNCTDDASLEEGEIREAPVSEDYQALKDEDDETGSPDADEDRTNVAEGTLQRAMEEDEEEDNASAPSEYAAGGEDDGADADHPADHLNGPDPLRGVFPSDAATWAQMKAGLHDGEDDQEVMQDARPDSPQDDELPPPPLTASSELSVLTDNGGLPTQNRVPPSASSSMDPFEFDSVNVARAGSARDAESDTVSDSASDKQDQNDVREVLDLLRTSPLPPHHGLSSPINLGGPSRLSALNDEAETEFLAALEDDPEAPEGLFDNNAQHARTQSKSSAAFSFNSKTNVLPPTSPAYSASTRAASIALPESDSNRSLSTIPQSDSLKSLASQASSSSLQPPSLSGKESFMMVDPPRNVNRAGGIPADWAAAMAGLRSRKNSEATTHNHDHLATDTAGTDGERNDKPGVTVTEEGDSTVVSEGGNSTLPAPFSPAAFIAQELQRRGSQASVAEIEAHISRSRSSSIAMMDDLDEIERALAELSPRALKTRQNGGSYSSPAPMPHLNRFFNREQSVKEMPGYQSNSSLEEAAPDTPSALDSDGGSILEAPAPILSNPPPRTSSSSETPRQILPELPSRSDAGSESEGNDVEEEPPLQQEVNQPISPRAAARASTLTMLPYNAPSPMSSPPLPPSPAMLPLMPRQVEADSPSVQAAPAAVVEETDISQEISITSPVSDEVSSGKSTSSSKFGGLRLKGWPGKSKDKGDKHKEPSPKDTNPAAAPPALDTSNTSIGNISTTASNGYNVHPARESSPSPQDPDSAKSPKSPKGAFRGLKFWQKDDHAKESMDSIQRESNDMAS